MTGEPSLVAVDLGGTTVKAARVGFDGRFHERLVVPTPRAGGPAAVAAVAEIARRLVTPTTAGVAVAVPGVVDVPTGRVRFSANLAMTDLPVVAQLRELLAVSSVVPVTLQQDVRGACEAEMRLGLGAGVSDLLCVVLGTGLAAGVISGGRLVRGAGGAAGELGHVPVVPDGEPCACGGRGCTEVYASAGGLARRYAAAGGDPRRDAAAIAAVLGHDDLADRVWAQAVDVLARAVAGVVLVLDPSLVVLAGGLSRAGEVLRQPVADRLRELLPWRDAPGVHTSPLGADAGLFGAALAAADAAGCDTGRWPAVPVAGLTPAGAA